MPIRSASSNILFPSLLTGLFIASAWAGNAHDAYPWRLALQDQDGRPFNVSDYRGKILILGFMFTQCANACPLQTGKLAAIERRLPSGLKSRTRFLSVSIDPDRDSAAALAAYAKAFGADTRHWRFGMTKDAPALKSFLAQAGVSTADSGNGSIGHNMAVLMIDAGGRVVQRYPGNRLDESRMVAEIAGADRVFQARVGGE